MEETYGAPGRGRDGAAATGGVPDVLLDRTFGLDDITVVRHQVGDRLVAAGVDADRLPGYVLAVNEVITNVALHAGPSGRIVLEHRAGALWCTVTDTGPGIPEPYLDPDVPGAFATGGRGIWLAHQLCDEVRVSAGPGGSTVALRLSPDRHAASSGLVDGASAGG